MAGLARERSGLRPAADAQVEGVFNYVDPARLGEWDRNFWFDHAWSGIPGISRSMTVTDACALADRPRFDREGFQTAFLGIGDIDFHDERDIERIWRPAACRVMQEITGADAVVAWRSGLRFSERDAQVKRNEASNPARRVHGDFSPSHFAEHIDHPEALAAIEPVAAGRKIRRWIGCNVWQPLSPSPYDVPLAVCDTRTVTPADVVVATGTVEHDRDVHIELALYAYNQKHRWFFYSSMEPGEALVFNGLDSDVPGQWRLVPHSAFDNPACPEGTPPRHSMETRTMALFFE